MLEDSRQKEIHLLEILKDSPTAGQRDMAEAVGLSLGTTNFLLKKLSARGWMLMRRLNARKVQYVLTPEGIKELSRRSYRFLKKSIRQVADYRVQLETVVLNAKRSGVAGLELVGSSGLDFVLDYLCRQYQLPFRAVSEKSCEPGWFVVFGENETQQSPNILDFMEHSSLQQPEGHRT